jgi:hypothetical protein
VPQPKSAFDRLRPLDFRRPDEVLDESEMYTVYEISRLLQGLDPDTELDVETEDVLLIWTIPWMIENAEEFCFADPDRDDEPGYYGLQ